MTDLPRDEHGRFTGPMSRAQKAKLAFERSAEASGATTPAPEPPKPPAPSPDLAAQIGGRIAQQMLAITDLAKESQSLSDLVRTLDGTGTSDGRSYWLWWERDGLVLSRRVLGREPGDTQFGVAGTPGFWLQLARVASHDVIWAPTYRQAEQRLAELESDATRNRAAKMAEVQRVVHG